MRLRGTARQAGASLGLRRASGRKWEVLLCPALDLAPAPDAATCEDLGRRWEVLPVGVAGGARSAHAEEFDDLGEAEQIVGRHEGDGSRGLRQTWD